MRQFYLICALALGISFAQAQPVFKAIVSQPSVLLGQSFQVQYIIEEPEKSGNFTPPDFRGFRIVAGPNIFIGSVMIHGAPKQVRNLVYTLSPLSPGSFVIPSAMIGFGNRIIRSNEVLIDVVLTDDDNKRSSKGASEYYLRPGEDPYEKIRKNLFLEVKVNRANCFVGEPVEATFKLYSRLESQSDIVKNPGFYGFTVYDMVNLADKQVTTENVKGRLFDVHTIRKVQLYPLQSGEYTVDAMEVKNSVEFSRNSEVKKQTEQDIIEGVLNTDKEKNKSGENTETFETEFHSDPITIHVNPVPLRNKPVTYSGAVGNFSISEELISQKLDSNEEGILKIVVKGKGNFVQFNAPAVEWPAGMEGFEPRVIDSLDKSQTPLAGSRTFRFPFVCSRPGDYTIPAIHFSFFDPDSGEYRSIATSALPVTINRELTPARKIAATEKKPGSGFPATGWIVAGLLLGILVTAGLVFQRNRKLKEQNIPVKIVSEKKPIDEIFASVLLAVDEGNSNFYPQLRDGIWTFFDEYFSLSGSGKNKERLVSKLREKNVQEDLVVTVYSILRQCEGGIFGKEKDEDEKMALVQQVKNILSRIRNYLL